MIRRRESSELAFPALLTGILWSSWLVISLESVHQAVAVDIDETELEIMLPEKCRSTPRATQSPCDGLGVVAS
jgi:hypothetical protein